MLSLMLWAYKNICRALSLAFLKSFIKISFATIEQPWQQLIPCAGCLSHLSELLHRCLKFPSVTVPICCFMSYTSKAIWGRISFSFQIFIASVTMGSFSVTEIPTCNVHSSEQMGKTDRERQNDLLKISCESWESGHCSSFCVCILFLTAIIFLIAEEVQAF